MIKIQNRLLRKILHQVIDLAMLQIAQARKELNLTCLEKIGQIVLRACNTMYSRIHHRETLSKTVHKSLTPIFSLHFLSMIRFRFKLKSRHLISLSKTSS